MTMTVCIDCDREFMPVKNRRGWQDRCDACAKTAQLAEWNNSIDAVTDDGTVLHFTVVRRVA